MNTNVRSGFLIARELGRRMKAAGAKGRMLFITSLHAESPRNLPHYSASKAGQTMVVKELARALGPSGIRVNALAPGAVPGGGFNAAAFDFSGKIPLGRLGNAQDMADMAASRCCPTASRATSPAPPWWWTAASRSTTGSRRPSDQAGGAGRAAQGQICT